MTADNDGIFEKVYLSHPDKRVRKAGKAVRSHSAKYLYAVYSVTVANCRCKDADKCL